MVGHHAGTCQDAPGGLVSSWVFSCSQPTDRHPGAGPAPMSAKRPGRRRSLCACDAAAQVCRRPSCGPPRPTQHHPFPSGPVRAGDHAARGPRRHVEPIAPSGDGPRHRAIPGSSAVRTARRQSRGHRRPVRPDTWMAPVAWTPDAWTPDAWTPDVRLTDWTDVRTADRGRGQGDDRRSRRPDILATGDHPLGGQTSPGSQRLGALGHQ
jgi:hypothetical protein